MQHKNQEKLDQIRDYVIEFCSQNGCGPTIREVGKAMNVCKSTAKNYLSYLCSQGIISQNDKNHYEDNSYSYDKATADIKIVGSISCGPLSEATQENRGSFRLPRSFAGSGDLFMLQANGDSMINAGIDDGDLVMVRKDTKARYGDIVVALVDGQNSLKRLLLNKQTGKPYLHPENEKYEDIPIYDNLMIQGVATKVIKEL